MGSLIVLVVVMIESSGGSVYLNLLGFRKGVEFIPKKLGKNGLKGVHLLVHIYPPDKEISV
jgi:hypothetical protein